MTRLRSPSGPNEPGVITCSSLSSLATTGGLETVSERPAKAESKITLPTRAVTLTLGLLARGEEGSDMVTATPERGVGAIRSRRQALAAGRGRRTTLGRSGRAAPRVGFFGLLGSGNLGNDASFEVMLNFVHDRHPGAVVDAMCMGPEGLKDRYGVDAIPLQWYTQHQGRAGGLPPAVLKVFGKGADVVRTAWWVRRHDVVIVPGMGVLEATLPLRASGVPYAMFLLCAWGRVLGTKVALVSVGANVINQRLTRGLFDAAARLAFYRSYRDHQSRQAMRQRGLDVSGDPVYPDLVFRLPTPAGVSDDWTTVGVGVMAYSGGNDDRLRAEEIYARYVDTMTAFVRWLVDHGHRVRLFWGDHVDDQVVREILAGVDDYRPDEAGSPVVAEPFSSLRELIDEMAGVGAVVATRYHNVLSTLRLGKPTISIGYAGKHDALMEDMGMSEFSEPVQTLDIDRLIEQFQKLQSRAAEVSGTLMARNRTREGELDRQFAVLSSVLFGVEPSASNGPAARPRPAASGPVSPGH